MCLQRYWPIPDFASTDDDPLAWCSVCLGMRVLKDVCGISVCAWCDGTGLEENVRTTLVAPEPPT